jgi:hypothetical protein
VRQVQAAAENVQLVFDPIATGVNYVKLISDMNSAFQSVRRIVVPAVSATLLTWRRWPCCRLTR